MSTFAVAHLHQVTLGPPIVEYLERIDSTLIPFGGRFVVHGGPVELLEGSWSGALVIIEFPNRARARSWYTSTRYQDILPLRTAHSAGDVIFIDTVSAGHRATDVLDDVR